MTRFAESQIENLTAADSTSLAKPLAPEDVRPGDFVTPLHEIFELPSYLWLADPSLLPADQPVRIQLIARNGGVPFKVQSVCLPFVLVKSANGRSRTLDLRTYRLARLDREFATLSWKTRKKRRAKKKATK